MKKSWFSGASFLLCGVAVTCGCMSTPSEVQLKRLDREIEVLRRQLVDAKAEDVIRILGPPTSIADANKYGFAIATIPGKTNLVLKTVMRYKDRHFLVVLGADSKVVLILQDKEWGMGTPELSPAP
jgi:hypothetical protein